MRDGLTRRRLLQLGAASAFAMMARRRCAWSASAKPRYCVQVFMRGGIDPVFTTDPKLRSEVDSEIDVPYEASSIIEAGKLRLGPHFAAITKSSSRLAIVNGVRVFTANHEAGGANTVRLRTGSVEAMPTILDIIGATRDGQPLACVNLGTAIQPEDFSRRWFSGDELKMVERASPDELVMLAKVIRNQAHTLPAGSNERKTSIENIEDCARLFERVATLPRRPPTTTTPSPIVESLDQTLWLLENDLTKCVMVKVFLGWDSHYGNTEKQRSASFEFFPMLQHFFEQLDARRNAHGTLASNTRVILTSEVGRYPRLNTDLGKDHFPELPVLLYGPQLAANSVFGQSGRQMQSLPVDLSTGRPIDRGHPVRLDDIGVTLLRSFDLDPAMYGYDGRVLDFLGMT